ncbi:hypothetical protein FH972_019740 [Carpinus fangiana]|uniref:3-hydroxyacyl-CoA dehydrogenase C-terminal domain-containing protein n=1 Tax=Carpinus fangiana TaxID=176857 RepID=A0A5N6RSK3_9ROSI|nr:hypothetical protein FH972_019740 [Carpinus fangiana]
MMRNRLILALILVVLFGGFSSASAVHPANVVERIKKTPVVVGDCTGFAVNRMLFPYAQADTLLVERGADLNQIDRAILNLECQWALSGETTLKGLNVYDEKIEASPDLESRKIH